MVLGLVLAASVGLALAGPEALPRSMLLMLREGREDEVLRAIYGGEPVFGEWLASSWVLPIRPAVAVHFGEALLALGLVALLEWPRTGRTAGPLVLMTFGWSAWLLHAARSPGPETTIVLAALLPAHGWTMRGEGAARWLPVGVLAACAAVAGFLRGETLVVSLPALLLALVPPGPRLEAAFARIPPAVRVVGVILAGELALALLGLAFGATGVHRGLSEPPMLPWGAGHLATLRLPLDVARFASPGFAVLVLLGIGAAALRGPATFVLAAAALLLERIYAVEEHLGAAPFETLRHHAMSQGLLALLALAGAGWLVPRLGRWAPPVAAALFATALFGWPPAPGGVPRPPAVVETTQTAGTRFLVEVAEKWSRCVLISPTATGTIDRTGPQEGWTYGWTTTFHGVPLLPGGETTDAGEARRRLEARGAAEQAPLDLPPGWPTELAHAPCLVWVHGLDCDLNGADCLGPVAGLEPVVDVSLDLPEHNVHHGGHRRPLRLAAWYVGPR